MALLKGALRVCARAAAISCVLLHPVVISDERCSLVAMAASPQLLLSCLPHLLWIHARCYHVALVCRPFQPARAGLLCGEIPYSFVRLSFLSLPVLSGDWLKSAVVSLYVTSTLRKLTERFP